MKSFKSFLIENEGKPFGIHPAQFKADLADGGHQYDHLHDHAQGKLGDVSHVSHDEKNSISRWTQNSPVGYKEMNAALRNDHMGGEAGRHVANLSDAIGRHSLPTDVYAYRGVHGPHATNLNQMKPGDTFHNKGFSSTTLDPNRATHFARGSDMMAIHIPKGTNGLYTSHPHVNGWTQERELTLQHGTHYKYHGSETIEAPTYHYSGEPTGDKKKIRLHHVSVVPHGEESHPLDESVCLNF